ncbi:helix-turn-helix domain-containing protein [Nocardia brasiliensis]|uniref:helix-turn-helix domain-containing protein n=1 Tax=Nocardia brasiliensis TaxID=37326 RepID=UPI00313B8EA9
MTSSHPEPQHFPAEGRFPADEAIDLTDPSADEIWLSTAELAHRLKIRPKTLATWAAAGRGPRYARMGRYRRYRLADVVLWELEQLAKGGGGRPAAEPYSR